MGTNNITLRVRDFKGFRHVITPADTGATWELHGPGDAATWQVGADPFKVLGPVVASGHADTVDAAFAASQAARS
jgi:hypothetical protein